MREKTRFFDTVAPHIIYTNLYKYLILLAACDPSSRLEHEKKTVCKRLYQTPKPWYLFINDLLHTKADKGKR